MSLEAIVYGVCNTKVWMFFFKQKTAYDMRISDWSSDVCSSDLQDLDLIFDAPAFIFELDLDDLAGHLGLRDGEYAGQRQQFAALHGLADGVLFGALALGLGRAVVVRLFKAVGNGWGRGIAERQRAGGEQGEGRSETHLDVL